MNEPERTEPAATEPVSFGRRITQLAEAHPERIAITHAAADGTERDVTWRELDARSNQVARLLASRGVGQGAMVTVAITNSPEHYFSVIGAWKLGATVLPMRWDLPVWERERLLGLSEAKVVVANWEDGPANMISLEQLRASASLDAGVLPDRIPNPANAISSSGSTGRPKLIVAPGPGVFGDLGFASVKQMLGLRPSPVQLVISPLYHTNGFMSHDGLRDGNHLVVMEKFDPERVISLIERHAVNFIVMVPIMLQRIARVPGVRERNFSSIEAILYGAAPLAPWIARIWLDLVGPEHFFFVYGGTERIGTTMANGVEWRGHEGTVGKPVACEVRIQDADGRPLPAGEIGDIFMKSLLPMKTFEYRGAPPPSTTQDGFSTFGDLGWVDEDGYLYIADRRVDMIISGGANVFPAEVETALSEHPEVADVVVVGLPDEEWGRRLHAIVERAADSTITETALKEHCRSRLAPYKVPKTFEFVERMPRTAAGKVNRGTLTTERTAPEARA